MSRVATAAAAIGLALAGCATAPPLQDRLQTYVGLSETALVSSLGVPSGVYESGGIKFLQFSQQRTQVVPGDPWWGPRPWGRWGPAFPPPPSYVVLVCDVTFSLRGGVVEGYSFRGDGCR
jgi:hypothetical protein